MQAIVDYKRMGIAVLMALAFASCNKDPFITKPMAEVTLGVNDNRLQQNEIHLSKDTVYVITSSINRSAGQKLMVDAGTVVKINDKLSINIHPGAEIQLNGTANEPVVFTSSAQKGGAGIGGGGVSGSHYWYGIRIYGNALTQPGVSSGSITYTRIEFAGGDENISGLPCLLLQDVTKETKLENIQVSYAFSTPSFEFNGGECNAKNLVSYASGSSDFHIRNGYTGMLQFLLAWRHPYFPSTPGFVPAQALGGLVIEDSISLPVISNVTVIGPDVTKETNPIYSDTISKGPFGILNGRRVAAFVTRNGAKFHIRNSAFLAFPKGGFYLDDRTTAFALNDQRATFMYSWVHSNDSARSYYLWPDAFPPFTSKDFKELILQPAFNNRQVLNSDEFMLNNAFQYDAEPNPLPGSGSPLFSGANFDGLFGDAFFEKVAWLGAIGSVNQLTGWTNFIPLQTNYNN